MGGIDPQQMRERQNRDGKTYNECYAEWLSNPRRPRTLRARTVEEYERIYRL
jgi:hypothetical protein